MGHSSGWGTSWPGRRGVSLPSPSRQLFGRKNHATFGHRVQREARRAPSGAGVPQPPLGTVLLNRHNGALNHYTNKDATTKYRGRGALTTTKPTMQQGRPGEAGRRQGKKGWP